MSRVKVGVLHPGTQHSWQTALALQEGGMLGWYATSIFYDPDKWPYRIERCLPRPLAERAHHSFQRRCDPRLDPRLVRQIGPWGWIAAGAGALSRGRLAGWASREASRDCQRRVVGLLEREPVDVVWAYDTVALEAFRWAKKRGIPCVLERTIAHNATAGEVMADEYSRHPEFFVAPFSPKPRRQLDEEEEELELADVVLVGSQFCAETLIKHHCSRGKIRVLGYGYDDRFFPVAPPVRRPPADRPVNFLFAGLVAPRKGIAYLLKAFSGISPQAAQLTLLGQLAIPPATLANFAGHAKHIGQVGRAEAARYFLSADCFVFPSRLEGSACVLQEIYGAGLGAIHTRAAGEGVVDGRNGALVEEASVAALAEAIERVLADRGCLVRWQEESWERRHHHTWSVYRQGVRDVAEAALASRNWRRTGAGEAFSPSLAAPDSSPAGSGD